MNFIHSSRQTGFKPLETEPSRGDASQLHRSTEGFTIMELLIATTIFSLVLLLISNGVLQAGRLFHKGVTLSSTQEVVRVIMDDVSQSIQFNGGEVVTPIEPVPPFEGLCVGGRRYSYITNVQLTDNPSPNPDQANHVLVVDDFPACNGETLAQDLRGALADESRELMGLRMRLTKFNIERIGDPRRELYNVSVRVVYGDSDLLDPVTKDRCRDIREGNQFCSASELTTTVQKRIK